MLLSNELAAKTRKQFLLSEIKNLSHFFNGYSNLSYSFTARIYCSYKALEA